MPVLLYRIDDRLIHGQVVVGWGQPLSIEYIVLVDDAVAAEEWEQELYRMGVPPDVDVVFLTVAAAAAQVRELEASKRRGILLTGTAESMLELVRLTDHAISSVNVGGIHHKEGRAQKLRYVFLTSDEEDTLRAIDAAGAVVTAQDVPSARKVSLSDVLAGEDA